MNYSKWLLHESWLVYIIIHNSVFAGGGSGGCDFAENINPWAQPPGRLEAEIQPEILEPTWTVFTFHKIQLQDTRCNLYARRKNKHTVFRSNAYLSTTALLLAKHVQTAWYVTKLDALRVGADRHGVFVTRRLCCFFKYVNLDNVCVQVNLHIHFNTQNNILILIRFLDVINSELIFGDRAGAPSDLCANV